MAGNEVIEQIKIMSGGRLVIENYASGGIIPKEEELAGLAKGSVDAIHVGPGFTIRYVEQAAAVDDTVGGLTVIQLMLWLKSGGGIELAQKVYDQVDGIQFIGPHILQPAEVWCHSTVPINSLDDLQGLKIRLAGEAGEIISKMGVSAVTMSGSEIYESIQRGVIDACEYSSPGTNWITGLQEVTDYMYISASRSPSESYYLIVSEESWNELPADLQAIVQKAEWDQVLKRLGNALAEDAEAIEKFKEYGNEVSLLNPEIDEALYTAAKKFYSEKCASDPLYGEVYQSKLSWRDICWASGIK